MPKLYTHTDSSNNKFFYKDPEHKILHREGGPAVLWVDGDQEWRVDGKLHRLDGPAVEWMDGSNYWWAYGKLHNTEGPAVTKPDGSRAWYINNKLIFALNGAGRLTNRMK